MIIDNINKVVEEIEQHYDVEDDKRLCAICGADWNKGEETAHADTCSVGQLKKELEKAESLVMP